MSVVYPNSRRVKLTLHPTRGFFKNAILDAIELVYRRWRVTLVKVTKKGSVRVSVDANLDSRATVDYKHVCLLRMKIAIFGVKQAFHKSRHPFLGVKLSLEDSRFPNAIKLFEILYSRLILR